MITEASTSCASVISTSESRVLRRSRLDHGIGRPVWVATLLTERLRFTVRGGANAVAKILALVAGMIAGADSIEDMDLLRQRSSQPRCLRFRIGRTRVLALQLRPLRVPPATAARARSRYILTARR